MKVWLHLASQQLCARHLVCARLCCLWWGFRGEHDWAIVNEIYYGNSREWWRGSRPTENDGLLDGLIFEPHRIRANHAKTFGKSTSERWNSQCRDPEVKINCVCVSSKETQGKDRSWRGSRCRQERDSKGVWACWILFCVWWGTIGGVSRESTSNLQCPFFIDFGKLIVFLATFWT